MILFALPLGFLLPTVSGWTAIRLLEWRSPVLLGAERWVLGGVVGSTATMCLTFLAHVVTGVPLSLVGFLSVQVILTAVLGGIWMTFKPGGESPLAAPRGTLTRRQWIAVAVLGLWTACKIASGAMTLLLTPTVFDDSIDNWNMRAKMIFVTHEVPLASPGEAPIGGGGIHSYPATVPMTKAWLASVAGVWSEGLINAVHLVYYVATLLLLFFALRRSSSLLWSLLGVYLLTSLPLFLLHGTVAYADGFEALHLFAALSLLWRAAESRDADTAMSFLRLAALAGGLLTFTKNEGLILYLPVFLIAFALALTWIRRRARIGMSEIIRALGWLAACIAAVAVPWVLYKWSHGFVFGNSHDIGSIALRVHPMVMISLTVTTLFEGNWLLIFPLAIILLILGWRRATASPLSVLTVFFLIAYGLQLCIFFFTGLANEAVKQTGYARGVVHLLPIMTLLVTVLLRDLLTAQSEEPRTD